MTALKELPMIHIGGFMKIDNLMKIEMIKYLDREFLEEALKSAQILEKQYQKNAVLHFEDDVCEDLEIVLSGEIVVSRINEKGNVFTVNHFKEGSLIGANLLFSSNPVYPMTLITTQDTRVLRISRDVIQKALLVPEFMLHFVQHISDQASFLGDKIRLHMSSSIEENIMMMLHHNKIKTGSTVLTLKMTKKDLAESMGIQRTSLSRELKKMKDAGLIDFGKDWISLSE